MDLTILSPAYISQAELSTGVAAGSTGLATQSKSRHHAMVLPQAPLTTSGDMHTDIRPLKPADGLEQAHGQGPLLPARAGGLLRPVCMCSLVKKKLHVTKRAATLS